MGGGREEVLGRGMGMGVFLVVVGEERSGDLGEGWLLGSW